MSAKRGRRTANLLLAIATIASLSACAREGGFPGPGPTTSTSTSTSTSTPTSTPTATPTSTSTSAPSAARSRAVRVEVPADAEVASFLRTERARAVRDGRKVLVEVGATWCKPCKTLKAALARGELDEVLDGVTIVAFDADAHGPRLDSLGYKSVFIPYFAIPKPDGSATEHQLDVKIPKEATAREMAGALAPLLRALRGT